MFKRGALGAWVLMLLSADAAFAEDPPVAEDPPDAERLPLRDPMQPYEPAQPAGAAPSAPRGFELSAVLVSESRRVAVINGDLRRVGDEIDGARLVRIEAESVRLQRGGKELVVHLNRRRARAATNEGAPSR